MSRSTHQNWHFSVLLGRSFQVCYINRGKSIQCFKSTYLWHTSLRRKLTYFFFFFFLKCSTISSEYPLFKFGFFRLYWHVSFSLQMRVYGSFLPAHSLQRWHPSPSSGAVLLSCLLDAVAAATTAATATAVRVRRREIKLRSHRRRRGAVRVRVWRGGEAVSAYGQNAADASHVRLQLQRHAAVRPQTAARGPHQACQVSREARRLRDGPMHRRARDAAPALGARHRMCALQAARTHATALQEAAERQRALSQQQFQVWALREN